MAAHDFAFALTLSGHAYDRDMLTDVVRSVLAHVGYAGKRHTIRRHHLLRISDKLVHRLGRPGNAAALERRRVAKIVSLARPSPKDAAETGPHFVSCAIDRVARVAVLENFLAAFGIALRVRHAGCQDKSRRYSCERLETHDHAETSGPGFFR